MIGPYAPHCVNGNKRIFKRKHEGLFILSWDPLSVDQLNALITFKTCVAVAMGSFDNVTQYDQFFAFSY